MLAWLALGFVLGAGCAFALMPVAAWALWRTITGHPPRLPKFPPLRCMTRRAYPDRASPERAEGATNGPTA